MTRRRDCENFPHHNGTRTIFHRTDVNISAVLTSWLHISGVYLVSGAPTWRLHHGCAQSYAYVENGAEDRLSAPRLKRAFKKKSK